MIHCIVAKWHCINMCYFPCIAAVCWPLSHLLSTHDLTSNTSLQVSDRSITGPNGDIPIRMYQPAHDGPLPLMVYFHGGGETERRLSSPSPLQPPPSMACSRGLLGTCAMHSIADVCLLVHTRELGTHEAADLNPVCQVLPLAASRVMMR